MIDANLFFNYIQVHLKDRPNECFWIGRDTDTKKLILSKSATHAEAFKITALGEANDYIQSMRDRVDYIKPINCATVEVFTPSMKRVLNIA